MSIFIFLLAAAQLSAQVDSVVWNFSSATGNPSTNLANAEFTCSSITGGNGFNVTSASVSSGYAGASGTYNIVLSATGSTLSTSSSNYIQWTISPKNNFKVGVTAIQFGMRSTPTGARAWALRSSKDDYASDLATGTNANDEKWKFHVAPLHYTVNGEAVTLRLYFYDCGSSGRSNTRLDDIKLSLTPPMLRTTPKILQVNTSLNTPSTVPVLVKGMLLEQDVTVASSSANFTVDKSSISFSEINSAPQTLNVTFSGTAASSGKIVLKSKASNVDITDSIFVTGAVGIPAISVSPAEINFTTTETGDFAQQTLKVTGAYLSDSIYLTFTAGDSVFSAQPKTLYKVANETAVSLRYMPLSAGATEGILRLSSAHAPDIFVNVAGSAIASDPNGGIPQGYYDLAKEKRDVLLKTTLHNIIKGHTEFSYNDVWVAYRDLDVRPECPKYTNETPDGTVAIWDMYTDRPGCVPYNSPCGELSTPYPAGHRCEGFKVYRTGLDQQGGEEDPGGGTEGNSYNREHSFPKSWWNNSETGTGVPQHNDLHHLYPTDRGVNSLRNNNPYCEVISPTRTTTNGSKFGACSGYAGNGFEPIDEYKGDLARTYFYMATRYENEFDVWGSYDDAKPMLAGNKYPGFKPWAVSMLLKWHRQDPVSKKEKDRNNTIYADWQKNRNPYIDHPDLAEY
ncbi:MAG: endonuclease, partial [Prevotellaceae bacterium]|nr:endonuclease [Prevotellaceae bacterium]